MNGKYWIVVASLLGALGVILGAYHAHSFEKKLKADETLNVEESQRRLDNCATGVRYQMYHALALLAVGVIGLRWPSRLLSASAALLTLGMALFSGGLYLHAFTGNIVHFAIIPSGGLVLIIGWVMLAVAAGKLPGADAGD